jgi:uncharacterized protein
MAGVLLTALSGRPLGHPSYWPIYDAATELDLPIVLHRGVEGINDAAPMSATGVPTSFAQYMVNAANPVISQLTSLITAGTFGRYPQLRVLAAGVGIAWMPGLLRKLEMEWRAVRREVPWVTEPPADYFARNVRVCTYGLEHSRVLERLVELNSGFQDLLCYGSGYPSWDTDTVGAVQELFPEEWRRKILFENADSWLRWGPRRPDDAPLPEAAAAGR